MGAVALERPRSVVRQVRREKVREGLTTAVRLSGRIFSSIRQPRVLVTAALTVLLVSSAIGVTVSAQQNRALFNTLSELQDRRDGYHREWSQLLLEQSALGAHSRIEFRAAEQLDMTVPSREQIVLVTGRATAVSTNRR